VVNSLTKPDCTVCQTGLSGFCSYNSAAFFVKFHNHLFTPPLGDIKGFSLIPTHFYSLDTHTISSSSSSDMKDQITMALSDIIEQAMSILEAEEVGTMAKASLSLRQP
jgi:hypothetical protein